MLGRLFGRKDEDRSEEKQELKSIEKRLTKVEDRLVLVEHQVGIYKLRGKRA